MSRSPRMSPTYGELNRATVEICRALRESPLRMLSGERCEARAYLAEVLTRAYPDTSARQVMRWCGSRNIDLDADRAARLMSSGAWRDEVVMLGLQSIGRAGLVETLESGDIEHLIRQPAAALPESAPAPLTAPRRWASQPVSTNPYRRVIVRQPAAVAAVPMGEPPAGRSALDQLRAAEARPAGPAFSISAAGRLPAISDGHAHE